ncbi:MAG: tryptophan--tRNA ligase [SAR324 cluster bacterium]|nr:tryptophan--tRNA ligase [SAR324 cluster bacterium]
MKKRILSGVRPTGMLHLGNYFGALRQFVEFQSIDDNECFFFVADLHALTTKGGSDDINQASIDIAKGFIACGVDPAKSIIYKQSDINKIPYLATILGMLTSESWLRKCTTFKEKIAKEKIVSLGLLSYPVLMTADIIIMQTDFVPVGHDQLQHLEMARDITTKFNNRYGNTFKLPDVLKLKAIRVPGLDGTGKMGKSDQNYIGIFEEPSVIKKKVLACLTDQGADEGEMSQPIKNLYYLLKLCCPDDVYQKYLGFHQQKKVRFYGELKKELATHIIEFLTPLRVKYNSLKNDDVRDVLKIGQQKANLVAEEVFAKAFSNLKI